MPSSSAEQSCWASLALMALCGQYAASCQHSVSPAARLYAGVVPLRQAGEARLVEGIELFGIASITQLVAFLQGTPMPPVEPVEVLGERAGKHANRRLDLADVVGQVRRSGPARQPRPVAITCSSTAHQWSRKTMLAERLPGMLPDLDVHDALEVSAVHSLAGSDLADELITRSPYSDPHHSASVAAIVGGGQRMARRGAISCAHRGILFSGRLHGTPINPSAARPCSTMPPSGRVGFYVDGRHE